MNEEYLWNKTGTDAEVEGLERALGSFSYKPTAPPELPAKTFAAVPTPRHSFWRLGVAFASGMAAAAVVLVLWFLLPTRGVLVPTESARTAQFPTPAPPRAEITPLRSAEPNGSAPTQTIIKANYITHPAVRKEAAVAVRSKEKAPPVKLTDEEKYAYGQLMLALSITESKLKIVRDTVAGNENTRSVVEKGNNFYQK